MDRFATPRRSSYNVGSNGVCRQFINGSCRFGTRCQYLHEWPVVPAAQICRYFQKGGCWYGERCRYLHVLQPDGGAAVDGRRGSVPHLYSSCVGRDLPDRRGSEPALPQAWVASGREHSGSESVFVTASNPQHASGHLTTDISEEQGSQGCLLEQDANYNLTASQESVQSPEMIEAGVSNSRNQQTSSKETTEDDGGAAAAAPAAAPTSLAEFYVLSKDVTCGICMDKVYEKMFPDEQRFGILPNCNHAFCLKCIITWRKTKDLREEVTKSCPQCRVKSAFYIPNNYWVEGQAKETLIASFKERCSKRRCSYFVRSGSCPFKSECIYRHEAVRRRRRSSNSYLAEEVEDIDILQLFNLVKAMTLFADFDDDDDSDGELPYYLYF